eukprot:Tamp_07593.p1 GENE.Tamp_07593~~Tamp_07593.p1  ORF type:complete len:171 (+),score=36.24 Tamp_07593:1104-1616(+)
MVDVLTFERINPNMRISQQEAEESGTLCLEEEQLYMCWPTLQGFSFAAKKWGEIDVDHCDSIAFDDGAFDSLVLASEKKTLIKSLVDNYQTSFSDLISGKGGGCIFLLHGQPGTGKTLTAEVHLAHPLSLSHSPSLPPSIPLSLPPSFSLCSSFLSLSLSLSPARSRTNH